jgi:hypothetical protein
MRRIISVVAVVTLMAAMMVATMLPAFAVSEPKVTVCHQNGNGTYEAIEVGASAADTHVAHGDFVVVDETTPCPPVVTG